MRREGPVYIGRGDVKRWQAEWLNNTVALTGYLNVCWHNRQFGGIQIWASWFDSVVPDPARRAAFFEGNEEEFFR